MPTVVKAKKAPKASPHQAPNVPTNDGLTPAQEKALAAEVAALGGDVFVFPGKAARRLAWSEKIQLAAERDAADLVRTPFHGEPPLTFDEIRSQRTRIAFLRVTQARWQMFLAKSSKSTADLAASLREAAQHRATLLRFFSLRYRNNAEGRTWVAHVREGSGDPDLIQDVADILERGKLEADALTQAPREEANAYARLQTLLPSLPRVLSGRSLGPDDEQSARKDAYNLRNGAYTLVLRGEQRIRAAAEYWYGDTDKMKDYAAFVSKTTRSGNDEDPSEEPEADVAAPS